jgi:hypothetical protein
MALSIMKNNNPDPRLSKIVNSKTGEVTYGFNPGNNYILRRTVTPHKTEEDIKKYTQVNSPEEIDFINNYRSASNINDATSVPYENDKHWNIPRLLFQPHVDEYSEESVGLMPKESKQSKEEYKNNILADMYKYFTIQNKGDKEKAWKQAKEFTEKEITPLFEGSVYNNRFSQNRANYVNAGNSQISNIVDDDYLKNRANTRLRKRFNPELLSEFDKKEQMPENEAKQYAIDWLTKYKKMLPDQAEIYYKTLENNAKNHYDKYWPMFQKKFEKPSLEPVTLKSMKKNEK